MSEPLSQTLRRLHEEATPGPWRHVEKGRVFNAHHLVTEGYVAYPEDDPEDETPETLAAEALTERTGKMIATLRNALPEIAALVEWMEARHGRCGYGCSGCRALAALTKKLEVK